MVVQSFWTAATRPGRVSRGTERRGVASGPASRRKTGRPSMPQGESYASQAFSVIRTLIVNLTNKDSALHSRGFGASPRLRLEVNHCAYHPGAAYLSKVF